jgi:hypothetical protein
MKRGKDYLGLILWLISELPDTLLIGIERRQIYMKLTEMPY